MTQIPTDFTKNAIQVDPRFIYIVEVSTGDYDEQRDVIDSVWETRPEADNRVKEINQRIQKLRDKYPDYPEMPYESDSDRKWKNYEKAADAHNEHSEFNSARVLKYKIGKRYGK